ncbi:hypothetical protein C8Q80DRAFT_1121532 [Daedaleopsis nitida]|nr:hypothetical protein C8Q80DRAFT_1121532 [Daedaleopsis nitida]
MSLLHAAPLFLALAAVLNGTAYAGFAGRPHSDYAFRTESIDSDITTSVARHRPHHPASDTCLYANATTLSDFTSYGLTSDYSLTSTYDTCICHDQLPSLLRSDLASSHTIDTVGNVKVEHAFRSYVSTSPYAQSCSYPARSTPSCSSDNPCAFVCDHPLVARGGSCICDDPNGCRMTPRSGSFDPRRAVTKRPRISALANTRSACEVHETICGSSDRTQGYYECVDTSAKVDLCGGCTIPSPFGLRYTRHIPAGVDCTAIPHVDVASCISGSCLVQSCLAGWTVNSQRSACIENHSAAPQDEDAPASIEQAVRRDLLAPTSLRGSPLRPHTNWRVPDIRSEKIKDHDDMRSSRLGPEQPKQDWTRIPDIRRYDRA